MSPSGLPQLQGRTFVTDGGLETTLLFLQGVDLHHFAAFPLVDSDAGRGALTSYFEPYLQLARDAARGLVLDTPTWRANPDWAARLGYDGAALDRVLHDCVGFARSLGRRHDDVELVVDGVLGPRGDGYVVGEAMSADQARDYHSPAAAALADAGVDLLTAVTMTYAEEATGIAQAAREHDVPVVISFTVETDGRLPSGQPLGEAVESVDLASDSTPAYYMVNCAHPTHFDDVLRAAAADGARWLGRVRGVRANASTMSHAELDEAEELDRGDPDGLAAHYAELGRVLDLAVVGGCCGTDHAHVGAVLAALDR